jgi:hypothetical protein
MMHFITLRVVFLLSILVLLPIKAAYAAPCEDAAIPAEGQNSVWYCWSDSDTAIIFVHGLHSSSATAWLSANGEYWPHLVIKDPALKEAERGGTPSVFLAGFYTKSDSTTYDMWEATQELKTRLTTGVGGRPPVIAKKNLFFVVHSLGGILVRALLRQYKDEFEGKRIGVLLVASPSMGSSIAYLASVWHLLTQSKMVDDIQEDSYYLKELDYEFKRLLDSRRLSIIGKEIYEHKPFVVAGIGTRIIVTKESAARYFPDPQQIPDSDHGTIAKPDSFSHLSHLALVELYPKVVMQRTPECEPPPRFEIELDVKTASAERGLNPAWPPEIKDFLPAYLFEEKLADGFFVDRPPVNRHASTGHYFYSPHGPFPCRGESFQAQFRRVPTTGVLTDAEQALTRLCFRRSVQFPAEKRVGLICQEGNECSIDKSNAGLATPCMRTGWLSPVLIASAHAQAGLHWEAPSLETLERLPRELRTGYAEFNVRSRHVSGVSTADHISYSLTVNGVELYIDGLAPHADRIRFNPAHGLDLNFALENLGFTGGDAGYERIALSIKYWDSQTLLKTATIERSYVSYRHAPLAEVTDPLNNDTYQWSGVYRPATVQASFEVVLASDGGSVAARVDKRRIDALRKRYNDSDIVGVIRPERTDNPLYGVTFGLRLATGQVKSLFTRDESDAICRWVVSESEIPAVMRETSYVFEFPAEAFTQDIDKGRPVAFCHQT